MATRKMPRTSERRGRVMAYDGRGHVVDAGRARRVSSRPAWGRAQRPKRRLCDAPPPCSTAHNQARRRACALAKPGPMRGVTTHHSLTTQVECVFVQCETLGADQTRMASSHRATRLRLRERALRYPHEACVDEFLAKAGDQGLYFPGINACDDFVYHVMQTCRRGS
jgi:hypothetical protein